MAENTEAKVSVDEGITARVRQEHPDAIITGYVWMAAFVKPEDTPGMTRYMYSSPPGQPTHTDVGLATYLLHIFKRRLG